VSERGLREVLSRAKKETRRQLRKAIEKKQKTGKRLMEILQQDVDREMLLSIWDFLQGPVDGDGSKGGEKQVKDVLLEGGWLTQEDLSDAQESGEAYDPQLGRHLVEAGHVTEKQLNDALSRQKKSGQSFWRILVNRGLVTPKQIADARKFAERKLEPVLSEEAVRELLLDKKLLTEEQWTWVMEERERTGHNIFQVLIDSNIVSKEDLGNALAEKLDLPWVDLEREPVEDSAVKLLPKYLARQNRMIPISIEGDTVRLAMANPEDVAGAESFRMISDKEVVPVLAFERDVLNAIERYYATEASKHAAESKNPIERLKRRLMHAAAVEDDMASMAEDAGVVNVVASVIEGAINSRATDVHLEPQMDSLRVRYRIDGMLYDIMALPGHLHEEVISRVKVLCDLDITERRRPQDGHFTIEALGREYDIRVATLPTILGEKMVLRILNPEDLFRGLRELGLEDEQRELLEDAVEQPDGMILATGPIGSGKTTTLYALLSEIDILTKNVVTIEDPVEYQLPGINQVQVDQRVERTFAKMLRSVVRQDVNVMMVGEIRDGETADVAVGAARTGHLVLSTMHTNDSVGAIVTLQHLGVKPFMITNTVTVVIAQRLVRRLCPDCRVEYEPEGPVIEAAGLEKGEAGKITFYQATGCERCYQMGYRGRTGIYEVLRITPELKRLILNGADHDDIMKTAHGEGMRTLLESGLAKVRQGVTSIDELLRVTYHAQDSSVDFTRQGKED
jgi:type IV pilus assembly protein PilB